MNVQMQSNVMDRYRSFLIAAIGLTGVLTSLLVALFLLQIEPDRKPSATVYVFDDLESFDLDSKPNDEDFLEVEVASLAGDSDLNNFTEAVTVALTTNPAFAPLLDQEPEDFDVGTDPRNRKPDGETIGKDPKSRFARKEHWTIRFTLQSEKEYLEQVDSLKIELGLLDKSKPQIEYAKNVSTKAVSRKDVRKNERRFYFMTSQNPAKKWNQNVFKKLGVETKNKIAIRFFPAELVKEMTKLELDAIEKKGVKKEDVMRTAFGLKKEGDQWRVYLINLMTR